MNLAEIKHQGEIKRQADEAIWYCLCPILEPYIKANFFHPQGQNHYKGITSITVYDEVVLVSFYECDSLVRKRISWSDLPIE